MSTHKPIPEEDIDLGSFFHQLIKLMKQFFAFLGRILNGIYSLLILMIIFYRKHFIPLTIALIVGLVVGVVVKNEATPVYYYKMLLEPNYESAYLIKDKVNYYNQLIGSGNTETLNDLFNLSDEDSQSLVKFEVKREENTKTLYDSFDNYVRGKDTLTLKQIEFEDYANENFSDYNAKYYALYLYLTNSQLKENIQQNLLKDLENNPDLKDKQESTLERLNLKEQHLRKLLADIDSVRVGNQRIALAAAQNGDKRTMIDMYKGHEKTYTDPDVNLLDYYKKTVLALDSILLEKNKLRHIYNLTTPFQPMGIAPKEFYKNPVIMFPLLFLILTSLVLLRRPFFNYLDNFNIYNASE